MAKNKQVDAVDEAVENAVAEQPADGTVLAKIVKDEEGNYRVVDMVTGETSDVCKFCDEGDKTIVLPKNSSNRKWANRKKADEAIATSGEFLLGYKATRVIGATGPRIPNEKLISYLSEEEQAEYKAIIDRAIAAREADRAKPMTDLEKAKAKAEKAKIAYEKLLAEAANN